MECVPEGGQIDCSGTYKGVTVITAATRFVSEITAISRSFKDFLLSIHKTFQLLFITLI